MKKVDERFSEQIKKSGDVKKWKRDEGEKSGQTKKLDEGCHEK